MTADPAHSHEHHVHQRRSIRPADYVPLLVLNGVCLAAAIAMAVGFNGAVGLTMHAYMGFTLCAFAMLKLFDLPRFADGFHMYDLIAMRWRGYGFIYPFLELVLGLLYFSYVAPVEVYFATAILFTVAGLGVFHALDRRIDVDCACMGTTLRVPLSTVSAVENTVMVVMALAMLAL